jgi:hypothetical protein
MPNSKFFTKKISSLLEDVSTSLTKAGNLLEDEVLPEVSRIRNLKLRRIRDQLNSQSLYVSTPVLGEFQGSPHEKFNLQNTTLFPKYSIVLLNNNDILKFGIDRYSKMYLENPASLFIVWDFDNHHWLPQSLQLCLLSDIYVPAHDENLYFISRLNEFFLSPIQCSSIQWSRKFLSESQDLIVSRNRQTGPLGVHKKYLQFKRRNALISKLNPHFPHVKLGGTDWEERSALIRLSEWASFKTHLIVPVRNDLPIRFFDALISGGIPIAPLSLSPMVPEELQQYTIFYNNSEQLSHIKYCVKKGENLFDDLKSKGIVERHCQVINCWHIDVSVREIVKKALLKAKLSF